MHHTHPRKVKQAIELEDALVKGKQQTKLYLFPSERRFWEQRGLSVILIADKSNISSSCIVSGDFAKAIKGIIA